jgi:osmoprotectant transport system ATP-binding protein
MSPAAVCFRDVWYSAGKTEILRGLSLDLQPGETLVLLGRSGAGKTTALKMVNALLRPDHGAVLVDGRPVSEWEPVRLRRRIGYVIQDVGLFPHYTVAENVALVPRLEGWDEGRIEQRVHELLQLVGLAPAEFRRRYPRELSGGQRQRVGVARALAADPPLLLLDEPFGALDPVTRSDLQQEFLALRRTLGKTSLFVTHDVREALLVGTRIALMREGRIETLAAPDRFVGLEDPEVRTFLRCLEWKGEAWFGQA